MKKAISLFQEIETAAIAAHENKLGLGEYPMNKLYEKFKYILIHPSRLEDFRVYNDFSNIAGQVDKITFMGLKVVVSLDIEENELIVC